MRSVRLDDRRERRLREAAVRYGISESEFIRRALDKACDEALGAETLYDRIKDLIEVEEPGTTSEPQERIARRHHEVFGRMVETKFARIKASRAQRQRDHRPAD